MASEDSDQVSPGLTMVHLLSEQRDLNQPVSRKMVPAGNQLEALRETLEVLLLRRPQRVLAKERDDRPKQVSAPTDVVLHEVFTMIVVPGSFCRAGRLRRSA
jgi:hypothetical protein